VHAATAPAAAAAAAAAAGAAAVGAASSSGSSWRIASSPIASTIPSTPSMSPLVGDGGVLSIARETVGAGTEQVEHEQRVQSVVVGAVSLSVR